MLLVSGSVVLLWHAMAFKGAYAWFPSHLFEHFIIDANCLAGYASNVSTGELMPAQLQESVHAWRVS